MKTKLIRITEVAKKDPKVKFTLLVHLLNEESLKQCHFELPNNKATGVHRSTKEEYGENLEEIISNLVLRKKKNNYKPAPVRRTYIGKTGSNKKRPLGIPEHDSFLSKTSLELAVSISSMENIQTIFLNSSYN